MQKLVSLYNQDYYKVLTTTKFMKAKTANYEI